MKYIAVLLTALVTFTGCKESFVVDTTPPAPPQGIRAYARDNAIELTWLKNTEPDLAGYKVWVSDSYDGRYELIASTRSTNFTDRGASNGVRSYYALSAYDYEGNESELSADVVYATARPEGYGVRLTDYRVSPNLAGYDFSTNSVGRYNDDNTDVFFEYFNGRHYLNVWEDTDIQGMGFTASLYDITVAPAAGWAPSRSVEAIPGHTYVIWTWDDHYAKIRVREVNSFQVTFDWAYQVATGNPDLKRSRLQGEQRQLRAQSPPGFNR